MGILKIDEELHDLLRERAKDEGTTIGNAIRKCAGLPMLLSKPRGRPTDEDSPRNRAKLAGEKTFTADPCAKCGSIKRRTDTGACAGCLSIRAKVKKVPGEDADFAFVRWRLYQNGQDAMKDRGEDPEYTYFSPVACPECGGHSRRLLSGLCSNCFTGSGVRIR